MVCNSRNLCVNISAAQILSRYYFTSRCLNQWRPAQENSSLPANNHRLIAHSRHISAACSTRSKHRRDLRNTLGTHPSLVVKDPSKMIPIRKNLSLIRQIRTTRIHQVNARQVIFFSNLLGSQVLLHRHWKVGSTFHRSVIRHNDTLTSMNSPNSGRHSSSRGCIPIHILRCQSAEFKEARTWIQ